MIKRAKAAVAVFIFLLSVFVLIWIFKPKTPFTFQDNNQTPNTNTMWWLQETEYESDRVEQEWILDAEIPANYIPVPAQKELYMVVDNAGNIVEYRRRYHAEGDDVTWYWETVNPDIPDNYVAVEGVENLYCVTDDKGNKTYLLYIRNENDTFAFVEADENGNIIEESFDNPTAENEIPENYYKITDNIYAVSDENGVIIGYKQMSKKENGEVEWTNISSKDIAQIMGSESPSKNTTTQATGLPPLIENLNTTTTTKPAITTTPVQTAPSQTTTTTTTTTQPNTSTSTEISYTSEIKDGYKITYKHTITITYDAKGNILSSKKETEEYSREPYTGGGGFQAPDTSLIKPTLDEELIRVSDGMTFKDDIADEMVALVNAERKSQNIASLSYSKNSNAYKLARVLAADMARYNYCDYDSLSYGYLSDLMARYKITAVSNGENLWQCMSSKSASDIHSRFQSLESSRNMRMNSSFTSIGIAVAYSNGYYYVVEVLL